MGDIKNFLYAWCGKRKMTPAYEIRAVGNKNRQKFMCEVLKNTVYILCESSSGVKGKASVADCRRIYFDLAAFIFKGALF